MSWCVMCLDLGLRRQVLRIDPAVFLVSVDARPFGLRFMLLPLCEWGVLFGGEGLAEQGMGGHARAWQGSMWRKGCGGGEPNLHPLGGRSTLPLRLSEALMKTPLQGYWFFGFHLVVVTITHQTKALDVKRARPGGGPRRKGRQGVGALEEGAMPWKKKSRVWLATLVRAWGDCHRGLFREEMAMPICLHLSPSSTPQRTCILYPLLWECSRRSGEEKNRREAGNRWARVRAGRDVATGSSEHAVELRDTEP